jgi:hypothetical protein
LGRRSARESAEQLSGRDDLAAIGLGDSLCQLGLVGRTQVEGGASLADDDGYPCALCQLDALVGDDAPFWTRAEKTCMAIDIVYP